MQLHYPIRLHDVQRCSFARHGEVLCPCSYTDSVCLVAKCCWVSVGTCAICGQLEHVQYGDSWNMCNMRTVGTCAICGQLEHVQYADSWNVCNMRTVGTCAICGQLERVQYADSWNVCNMRTVGTCAICGQLEHSSVQRNLLDDVTQSTSTPMRTINALCV